MRYSIFLCLPFLYLFSQSAYAVECEVDYLAKKTTEDKKLFGTKKKSEVKRGTAKGKGSDEGKCRDAALSELIKDGWKITSDKVRVK